MSSATIEIIELMIGSTPTIPCSPCCTSAGPTTACRTSGPTAAGSPCRSCWERCRCSAVSLLTRWTNGRLRPGRHRVLAGGSLTRLSSGVFWHPRVDTVIEPLGPFVGPGEPPAEDVVWSYPEPIPAAAAIKDHLAFYNEVVDITVDGQIQTRPGPSSVRVSPQLRRPEPPAGGSCGRRTGESGGGPRPQPGNLVVQTPSRRRSGAVTRRGHRRSRRPRLPRLGRPATAGTGWLPGTRDWG